MTTKTHDLEAELELSLLQISQLQEELEYYYTKYTEATNHPASEAGFNDDFLMPLKLLRNARLADEGYQNSSDATVNASLIRKLESVEAENQSLKEDCAQIETLKTDKKNLQDQLQQAHALSTELEGKNTALEEKTAELEGKNTALEEKTVELKGKNTALEEKTAELKGKNTALEEKTAELEGKNTALEEKTAELEGKNTELAEVLNGLKNECSAHKDRLTQQDNLIADSADSIENINRELIEAHQKNSSLQEQLSISEAEKDQLQEALDERTRQRDEENHWHNENKNWAESLNKQVEGLKAEAGEKNRTVSLSQKMLAKAQIDLDHLRESYAEKVTAEKELVELVKELREKLTLASKYYFKLQQEHPELLTSAEHTKAD